MLIGCNCASTACASRRPSASPPLDHYNGLWRDHRQSSGRSTTPAEINRNGRPTWIGTGADINRNARPTSSESAPDRVLTIYPKLTAVQQKAFDLLAVNPARTQ
jgi:hypothetical protein